MKNSLARIRGLGFILWQSRHMGYHVMLGLLWAWFLREQWGEFNVRWIVTAAIGSVLPDIDHLNYFFGYGKNDSYTKTVFGHVKKGEWRKLFYFISTGHKYNTNLSYHNIYVTGILIASTFLASFFDWRFGVVLLGAMVSHFLFDIFDDLVQLHTLNKNWGRWGRPQ